jgi:hypothetical protein
LSSLFREKMSGILFMHDREAQTEDLQWRDLGAEEEDGAQDEKNILWAT